MEFIATIFTDLFSILEHMGVWAYWIIFLIAFLDSLVVIGTFTSGTVFLVFAGVLVSRDVYDLADMTLFASVGAILGGLTSYCIGRVVARSFDDESKLSKTKRFTHGTQLLDTYGGAGILFGRFLGPASSVISFIAGLSKLPFRTFLLWNMFSGLVWGTSYVFIGNFFGQMFQF
jgi:membrane protein DedA with SNARE-associated domain